MGTFPTLKVMSGALTRSNLLSGFIERKRAVRRVITVTIMNDSEFNELFVKFNTDVKEDRLQTFLEGKWPQDCPVSVYELAVTGGFCYTGREDEVVCYSCKGKISQWQTGEVPIRMHCEAYPTCNFVRETERKMGGTQFDAIRGGPERVLAPFGDENNPSPDTYLTAELIFFGAEFNRLMTFCDWPLLNPVDRYDLAASGFIRPDEAKEHTVCVACGLEVKEWRLGDLPQKKHAELSPECPFVKEKDESNREMDNSEKYQFVKRGITSNR